MNMIAWSLIAWAHNNREAVVVYFTRYFVL